MASPSVISSSGLWTVLGQASNVAQLVGVDALGLVSMVVQAALAARRHRDACRRLAQHVEVVGGLLRELELAELMRREVTRRPLEQLRDALRRCYALVTACQDCGYLRSLFLGARMAEQLRAVEQDIDMFIRLVTLIALVDTTHERRVTQDDGVPVVTMNGSSHHHIRFPRSVEDFTRIQQGAPKICNVAKQPFAGAIDLQGQKILDTEELLELCTRTEESCSGFRKFEFSQIVDATDTFSEDRNVGWGGFAKVYKGELPDGLMIGVKRLNEHAAVYDFSNEFLLARLEHINLVRLLGWCIHGKERILVYEFMNKGGLHQFIFDKVKGPLLDWSKRLNIIKGLAEGLVYLHKHSIFCIVHRDLKPENVLLDHGMNPKISDFGSAVSLSSDASEGHTSRVVGTCGYKAPEYASRGIYSVKTDVFSFGVLALAVISGRNNIILEHQGDTVGSLVRDVRSRRSGGEQLGRKRVMAGLLDSSSGLWTVLGQASNVVQLVGVDALGLVSMVVQAALAARRHRDACRRLAQHVEVVGGPLRELEVAELMQREATRRPLEQLRDALRRCYALVTACQDCGYLRSLFFGARMADELRSAETEIDMFIRLVPLIALIDSTHDRNAKTAEEVPGLITNDSNHHVRSSRSVSDFTKIHIQGATQVCSVAKQPLAGALDLREQKSVNIEELLDLCIRTQEICSGFRRFEFFQIIDATDNFSESRNIGWGGFATVYKGQLPDGSMIAIKRMDEHATVFDFSNEFLLARLQHTNLIRLSGWCIHGKERILVYEFMHKGSLHHFIFDKRMGSLLDWSKRINIIKGLAEGLVYLHKQSKLWIVHRDLKPKNILLDHDMNPKIADFGSARTLSSDFAEECTSRVVGTSGYKAPEYTSRGVYSLKTDVFSFGVMVLVTISGRKNTILEKQGDSVGTLVRDAWQLWNDGRLHELVDPILGDEFELGEVMQYAQVALLCAQEEPADRPTMSDVVSLMNFQSISLLPAPKQPSELYKRDATGDKLSTYVSQSSRTIDITITSSAPMSTRVRIIVDPET